MRCPYCGNKDERCIEKVSVESSTSTWDDWDQIITYLCKKCDKKFTVTW